MLIERDTLRVCNFLVIGQRFPFDMKGMLIRIKRRTVFLFMMRLPLKVKSLFFMPKKGVDDDE